MTKQHCDYLDNVLLKSFLYCIYKGLQTRAIAESQYHAEGAYASLLRGLRSDYEIVFTTLVNYLRSEVIQIKNRPLYCLKE